MIFLLDFLKLGVEFGFCSCRLNQMSKVVKVVCFHARTQNLEPVTYAIH